MGHASAHFRSGGTAERRDQGLKNDEAVCRAKRRFHGALRMRHHAEDVAPAIAQAGDGLARTVGIGGGIERAVRRTVAEGNLIVAFQLGERSVVANVVAVSVRNGNAQHLAGAGGRSKGRRGGLNADVHVAADKAQAGIAHQRAGKQSRFAEDLEAIADAQDQAAGTGKSIEGPHDRRKTGDGAGAEIIAIRKAAGQDDRIEAGEIFGLVPDEFDRLPQDAADGVESVVIAIGTGKDDNTNFHRLATPWGRNIIAGDDKTFREILARGKPMLEVRDSKARRKYLLLRTRGGAIPYCCAQLTTGLQALSA